MLQADEAQNALLHGTLKVAVWEARHLPKHRNLQIRRCMPSAMDHCVGGAEQMTCGVRDPHAYVTVEIGPTKRCKSAVACWSAASGL